MGKYRMNQTINGCIKSGLIDDDYREVYDRWEGSFECEKCGHDYSYWKKCMDHSHFTGAFRAILCQACNLNDKVTNTSGYPNIYYHINERLWTYEKTIRKVRHKKRFKTKKQAINYKMEFESK